MASPGNEKSGSRSVERAENAINEALAWWDCQLSADDSYGIVPEVAVPVEDIIAAKIADENGAFCVEDVSCIADGTRALSYAAHYGDYPTTENRFNDTLLAFSAAPTETGAIQEQLLTEYGVYNGPIYHLARLAAAGTLNELPSA